MAEQESRNTHKVYEKDKIGEVQIADEVVAIIAGLAATEVEGVDSMAGNITNELVGKLGISKLFGFCKNQLPQGIRHTCLVIEGFADGDSGYVEGICDIFHRDFFHK